MWLECNDYVYDDKLIRLVQELEDKHKVNNPDFKYSLKAINAYSEAGYLGDSDIFARMEGLS